MYVYRKTQASYCHTVTKWSIAAVEFRLLNEPYEYRKKERVVGLVYILRGIG
jgi:hypothetical protein